MLDIQQCCLTIVDVQGKLAQLMHGKEALFKNVQILVQAAKILDGPTIPEIAELLDGNEPINKSAFSCCGEENFNAGLKDLARNQVLLCGIETHVCIYQTAVDLFRQDFHVEIIADAVSSRAPENKQIAINRLTAEGAKITCTETVLFELLKTAEHPNFRQIAKLVK
jgi:nicotinamidase-related amidase